MKNKLYKISLSICSLAVILISADGKAQNNKTASSSTLGINWQEMGPDNKGGRVRSILIDKNNNTRIFAGAASGGIWRSDNNGNSWSPVNDQYGNLNVSCLWQDNDGNIYIGTGEGNIRGGKGNGRSGFVGGGIYRMNYAAGADTYSNPVLFSSTSPAPNSNAVSGNWVYVNSIKTSKTKSGSFYTIYAGTNRGIWMSNDDGASWSNPTNDTTWCQDIEVGSNNSVYFTLSNPIKSKGKIFSADLALGTLNNITPPQALLDSNLAGRIELSVHKDSSNVIYASIAKPYLTSASLCKLAGVYQSKDNGSTWKQILSPSINMEPFGIDGTGDMAHSIIVSNTDPNTIYLGGDKIYRWDQVNAQNTGVGQWTSISDETASELSPFYVHTGINAFAQSESSPNTFFIATNGGIFRTSNGGFTYTAVNQNLNISQFYSVAFERDALATFGPNTGAYNGAGVFGGTQDNGTQFISGNGNTVYSSNKILGGTGGFSQASMLNPNVLFYTTTNGTIKRSATKDDVSATFFPERNMITCASILKPGDTAFASVFSPFALWESSDMTNSPDSVLFIVDSLKKVNAILANGWGTNYSFTIVKPQISTIIDAATLRIIVGTQSLNCDAAGNLTGSIGSGHYYSANDSVYISLNSAPAYNTAIGYAASIKYNSGSAINVKSNSLNLNFAYTLNQNIQSGDTVKIQDRIQARLAAGFNGSVMLCKNPLNVSGNPSWMKIAGDNSLQDDNVTNSGFTGKVRSMEWAGSDILYFGTENGDLFRLKGLSVLVDSASGGDVDSSKNFICYPNLNFTPRCTKIGSFNGPITSISVNPTNNDKVIITTGGYGNTQHVFYSTASTNCGFSASTANFVAISSVAMPVYSSAYIQTSYNENDPANFIIGTEDGLYSINLTNTSTGWISENGSNFPKVPVTMIKQQRLGNWESYNSGTVYVATHGRGIWKSEDYHTALAPGWSEINNSVKSGINLALFPNPSNGNSNIRFKLNTDAKSKILITDIDGKLIKQTDLGKLQKGNYLIPVEMSNVQQGLYFITLNVEGYAPLTGKLLITN